MKADFDKLQPVERQIILVASDAKYETLQSSLKHSKLSSWWPLLLLPLLPAAGPAGLVVAPKILLASHLTSTFLAGMGIRKLSDLRNTLEKKEIPIPHLSPQDACSRFSFDHGHPKDGTAYALSPVVDTHYLLPTNANERLAQEKIAAFHNLTASLGAKSVSLVSANVSEKKASARAKAALKSTAETVGIGASFDKSGQLEKRLSAEYGKPKNSPTVPEEVKPWLNEEPLWRSMVDSRIKSNMLKHNVSLSFGSDINLSVDLVTVMNQFNLDVGGAFKSMAKTSWNYEIEFYSAFE